MTCVVCNAEQMELGSLCQGCASTLQRPAGLCLEHIVWTPSTPDRDGAALIDSWGRPHTLQDGMVVGREPGQGLCVLESSISRRHARLFVVDDRWHVQDLDSSNGTRLQRKPTSGPTPLSAGTIVAFGDVAFYFVAKVVVPLHLTMSAETAQASTRRSAEGDVLREVVIRLVAPIGGRGGVVQLDHVAVHLSQIQFDLVALLEARLRAQPELPDHLRGFVATSELVSALQWKTSTPHDNNVKQLVRRLRKTMVRAGAGDVIEARQGAGYRLAIILRAPVEQ